jgi:hypothetical protein
MKWVSLQRKGPFFVVRYISYSVTMSWISTTWHSTRHERQHHLKKTSAWQTQYFRRLLKTWTLPSTHVSDRKFRLKIGHCWAIFSWLNESLANEKNDRLCSVHHHGLCYSDAAQSYSEAPNSPAAVAARILPCLLLFAWRQSSFIINNGAVVSSSFCHDDDSLDENSRHYHEGSWPNKARTINITEHKKCMIMKQDHIHYTINNNIWWIRKNVISSPWFPWWFSTKKYQK